MNTEQENTIDITTLSSTEPQRVVTISERMIDPIAISYNPETQRIEPLRATSENDNTTTEESVEVSPNQEEEEHNRRTGFKYYDGQLVRIKNVTDRESPGGVHFTWEMGQRKGKIYKAYIYGIENGEPIYHIDLECGRFYFIEDWLEPVEDIKEEIETNIEELIKIKLEETPTDEDLEKMLNLVDTNTILKIFKARMKTDGFSSEVLKEVNKNKINRYLKRWAKAKYRFYKLFGNKLKISTEIECEKDDVWFREKIKEIKMDYPLYKPIIKQIYIGDIRRNNMTFNSNTDFFQCEKVKPGMKFTRMMALYNNNDLNMAISKLYQDKSMKEVIISIDPLDYLTVSINKSWRSCHNFIDGEWRNAGLSLMMDKTSMVAYTTANDTIYNFDGIEFKANNKTWRQMLYLSETNSQIVASLQYPYQNEQLTKTARTLLEDTLANYLKVPNKWKVNENGSNIDLSSADTMYNDIGRNGCKYIINKYDKNKQTKLKTGSSIPCLNNGRATLSEGDEDLWY